MPYISPALSPTKALATLSYPSPPSSNPNSPPSGTSLFSAAHSVSANSASNGTKTVNEQREQGRTSANGTGHPSSSSYSNGFPRRPARHHSRSHSSDTLVTVNGPDSTSEKSTAYPRASKCTPDYIFVHPATPKPPERATSPSSSSSSSYPHYNTSYSRPALRSMSSSRTPSSSSLTLPAGEDGDVAPPRTARRSSTQKKFQISGSSPDVSPRESPRGSPHGSISLESGKAFTLPLPDLDAMSPPAFANRSSSSPALSSLQDAPPSYPSPTDIRDSYQRTNRFNSYSYFSPTTSSPATPEGEVRTPTPNTGKSTDLRADDSALTTSSEESKSGGSQEISSSSEAELMIPKAVRNKPSPSWGDVASTSNAPTPTMGPQTSFSFAASGGTSSSTPTPTPTPNAANGCDPIASLPPPGSKLPSSSSMTTSVSANSTFASANGASTTATTTSKPRRPGHAKAMSERSDRPTKLDLTYEKGTRAADFSEGPHSHTATTRNSKRGTPLPTPMLRKKSGELVKSSMKHDHATTNTMPSATFRAKSLPTTPTGPKAVHFDEQLERVKLFLAQQRPTAVSRDGSPIETETEDDSEAFPFPPMTTSIPSQISLVLPEFPHNSLPEIGNRDICLETLEIAADWKSLKGTALLRNLAFEKRLSIRFTFDDWQTISEVTGEWASTLVGGTIDRWTFTIKLQDLLARIEEKTMFMALKYSVNGGEIWDSNNGKNYRVEFRKSPARSQAVVGGARAARHEWAVTNPGQASERMADLRRELDRLVADQDDFGSSDEIVLTRDRNGFKYAPRFLGDEAVPLAQAPASSTFSSRYDFGASLKNAAHRNSPQTSHAILDNPYFASPADPSVSSWRNGPSALGSPPVTMSPSTPMPTFPLKATVFSPPPSNQSSLENSPPRPQFSSLYADGDAEMASSVVGNTAMPAITKALSAFAEPSATTPPASFSGSSYYPQASQNGVTATDFALPNYVSANLSNVRPVSPPVEQTSLEQFQQSLFMNGTGFGQEAQPDFGAKSTSVANTNQLADASSGPAGELIGGAPLSRQGGSNSYPPVRDAPSAASTSFASKSPSSSTGFAGASTKANSASRDSISSSVPSLSSSSLHSLDPPLDDQDPLDRSNYSPAATSPASSSPPRRASPPLMRPGSPEDLLSPSPSSASTDTSISTPQSPNGSPPLRMYSPYLTNSSSRPEMGSDTYFNFVHRCE